MTEEQRLLLEDKFLLWQKAAREDVHDLREYNQRCADALQAYLAAASEALSQDVQP